MRIAMLISGGGTTASAIFSACVSKQLEGVEPACVIASAPDVPGINRLKIASFPAQDIVVVSPRDFSSPELFGEAILQACVDRGVEFVGQYGWLPLTPPNVIEKFRGMIVNQHPTPLDPGRLDFGGKGMWGKRAVCARMLFVRRVNRDFWTEATAHRVEVEFDKGALLKTKRVEILPDDTVENLYARLLPIEYDVQIETIRDFVNGTVREVARSEPLVRPGEEEILYECKQGAIRLYPHG